MSKMTEIAEIFRWDAEDYETGRLVVYAAGEKARLMVELFNDPETTAVNYRIGSPCATEDLHAIGTSFLRASELLDDYIF